MPVQRLKAKVNARRSEKPNSSLIDSMLMARRRSITWARLHLASDWMSTYLTPSVCRRRCRVRGCRPRALAVASSKRNPALPNVPTFDELGVPKLYASSWYGLMGPAGLPPAMVQQLNAATNEVLRSPELLARMHELGAEVGGGSAEEFARFIQSEIQRYAEIVKKSGARME